MSEQPSRYQRSMSGMVGALLVTLLAIVAFVAWRALNREELELEPEPVDYLETVRTVQAAGETVPYPASLPDGWIATSAEYRPGRDRSWSVGTLTAQQEFAGLREEDASVDELVSSYVDEDAAEGDLVLLDSPLAGEWRSFTDAGGDYALATTLPDRTTVLVYGSATPEQIRGLAARLVTGPAPAPPGTGAQSS